MDLNVMRSKNKCYSIRLRHSNNSQNYTCLFLLCLETIGLKTRGVSASVSPQKVPWKAMTMAHITDFASVVRRPQRGAQKDQDILGRWRRCGPFSLSSSLPFESFAAKVFVGDSYEGQVPRQKSKNGTGYCAVSKSNSRRRVQ